MEKNGTPASPEMAFAIRVLPVPGGPTSSTPFGMRAPSEANFCGSLRNSTTSWSSCLASSAPATSAKVTVGLSPVNTRARLLPNDIAWLFEPCAWRRIIRNRPPISSSGRTVPRMVSQPDMSLGGETFSSTVANCSGVTPSFVSEVVRLTPSSLWEMKGGVLSLSCTVS